MSPRFLEDLRADETWQTGTLTVDEAMLREFAHCFDPQPMHTDPVAAEQSFFGELVGSGWHAACLTMRLVVESKPLGSTPLIGVEVSRIRFHKPLKPGMMLSATGTVLETRPLNSRPGHGIAQVGIETREGKSPLLSMQWTLLVPQRP